MADNKLIQAMRMRSRATPDTRNAAHCQTLVLCLHCGAALTAERDYGGSPGGGDTEWHDVAGESWCPADGACYPTRAVWLDGVRQHGYDNRPCQYHEQLHVNVELLTELIAEFSRAILKLAV